jgi:nucleoredoxin
MRMLGWGMLAVVAGTLNGTGSEGGGADPDRSLWPREVTVSVAVTAPVVINGKESGSITLPAGRTYRLLGVAGDMVAVDVGGSTKQVALGDTDFLTRVEEIRAARAAAPQATQPSAETPEPTATPAASEPPPSTALANTIGKELAGMLVVVHGRKLKPFEEDLGSKKFLVIYHSAGWCGPCRSFTPDLVRWYKRNRPRKDLFEVIFQSADRSAGDMLAYMTETKMPWPAVGYEQRAASPVARLPEGGIPCLVVVDETGEVIARTFVDGKYIGASNVLDAFDKTLKAAAGR